MVCGLAVLMGWQQTGREQRNGETGKGSNGEPTPVSVSPSRRLPVSPWQSLFNGEDLDGWRHLGGGKASVQDGVLVLENDEGCKSGYLVSDVSARDFAARLRCKIVSGDSGLFFRSRRHARTPTEIMGPQVQLNIEPDRGLGGIFELHGRGWIAKPPPEVNERLLHDLDWVDCEIHAQGNQVSVVLNGRSTVRFADDEPAKQEDTFKTYPTGGFFALQIHGGCMCKVLFREISVMILD